MPGHRCPRCGRLHQPSRIPSSQGLQGERRARARRDSESPLLFPPGHKDEPRPVAGLLRETAEQLRRGLVHPMRVLEHQDRRGGQDPTEEFAGHLAEPGPAELVLQLFDFRRHGDIHARGDSQERQHR